MPFPSFLVKRSANLSYNPRSTRDKPELMFPIFLMVENNEASDFITVLVIDAMTKCDELMTES